MTDTNLWADDSRIDDDIQRRLASRTLTPSLDTVGALRATPNVAIHRLNLADYIESEAQPAESVYRGAYPGFTDSLGNEDWGDCGDAMTDHAAEADDAAQGLQSAPFTEADALELYSENTGFNKNAGAPGSNPTDNGTDNAKLQQYMIQTGAPKTADGSRTRWIATAEVAIGDTVTEHIAILDLVNLYRAVGLPLNVQGKQAWFTGPGGAYAQVGSWGYHDIPYQGIRQPHGGFLANSWGMLVPVGVDWDRTYAVQGFVAFREWVLGKTGVSPNGLNWDRLVTDIRKVAGLG